MDRDTAHKLLKHAMPRILFLALLMSIVAEPGAEGQEATSPPTPSPSTPAADVSAREVLERLEKMEQMNRQLLERLDKVSKENLDLSKKVQDLNQKVDKTAETPKASKPKTADEDAEGSGGSSKSKEPPRSGLGGQFPLPPPDPNAANSEQSGVRSSGVRLLPDSQGIGNRRLGKIPLKAFYDYGRDGVGFATLDDEFLLKFRAEFQADNMNYLGAAQSPVHSGFYLPRVRYYFQGHYTKPIDYQLSFQRSYTSFGFLNVFANFNYFDDKFQARIGRFKVPFTYEWYKLNNYRFITPERSLFAANFGVNREIGAMAWGEILNKRLEYAVGIFDGPRNSSQDYNASKDVAAFLNYRPFNNWKDSPLTNFNVGGSMTYGSQDNPVIPTVLTTNTNATNDPILGSNPTSNAALPFLAFNTNVREKGIRSLWELHAAYYVNGFSFIAAWDAGQDSYALTNSNPVPIDIGGFFVSGSYLITGETLNERTVVDPIRRFDLRKGQFGLGAIEPFARFSAITLSDEVFTAGLADPNLWTSRVQLTDLGVNWYINRAVKLVFDWQHAIFAQPVYYGPGPALHSTNDLLWMRLQVYF